MAQDFSYLTRASKWIERHILSDVFGRIVRQPDAGSYRYIGFGALEFVDFALFHRRLNIDDMISIDKTQDPVEQVRIEANRPFDCIRVEFGHARDRIPEIDLDSKPTILWLDYEQHLDSELLSEVKDAAQRLGAGGVLTVTVKAHPDPMESRVSLLVDRLTRPVVDLHFPDGAKAEELTRQGLIALQSRLMREAVEAACRPDKGNILLLNLSYADNANMQTLTWFFHDADEYLRRELLLAEDWSANHYVRQTLDDPASTVQLKPPLLTHRERVALDRVVGTEELSEAAAQLGVRPAWASAYQKMYRWYPTYADVSSAI